MKRSTNAFTLLELLAVITVIAILVGLTLTALSSVQSSARATQCSSNLRQAYLAFSGYLHLHEMERAARLGFRGAHTHQQLVA